MCAKGGKTLAGVVRQVTGAAESAPTPAGVSSKSFLQKAVDSVNPAGDVTGNAVPKKKAKSRNGLLQAAVQQQTGSLG